MRQLIPLFGTLKVFTQRNFAADSFRQNLAFAGNSLIPSCIMYSLRLITWLFVLV